MISPLPRIDQIVDSTAGCETLSFLDAYSGYHQIRMKESDQLATSFITPFGMYCYVTMPFGLRNAGATYQRCMNHVFGEHIGRTVEAYVDDIVVKMRKASDLLSDLEVTFRCLKTKGVKLNPEKCVFGVPRGMLLGFIVSEWGIEANPEKIAAITSMGPIKDFKDTDQGKKIGMDFGAGRTLEYGVDDLSNVDLAYATTIHKAMGSEYETVIMPLLKAHTIMMYRNLLYTGITRAKKRVVLIGQKQVLFMAIHRNEIGKRNTLLGMRIQMYFKAYAKKAGIPIPAALEEQLKNAS